MGTGDGGDGAGKGGGIGSPGEVSVIVPSSRIFRLASFKSFVPRLCRWCTLPVSNLRSHHAVAYFPRDSTAINREPEGIKNCRICQEVKPLTEFRILNHKGNS